MSTRVGRGPRAGRGPRVGRIPREEHFDRDWRVHAIAPDFHVEDVWALPFTGTADDFDTLMSYVGGSHHGKDHPLMVRFLWTVRHRLGRALGWDIEDSGSADWTESLRERLPGDLRDGPRGPVFPHAPFSPLYLLDNEFAAEIANRTMHGVMHLSWVRDGEGYRGQMAVLVKPNGWLGTAYMSAIKPFRHLLVYPAMLRQWKHRQ